MSRPDAGNDDVLPGILSQQMLIRPGHSAARVEVCGLAGESVLRRYRPGGRGIGRTGLGRSAANQRAQVRRFASRPAAVACTARLEGVVVWASPAQEQLILQDDSGAIRVALRGQSLVQTGKRVRLEGKGLAGSGMLREALIENDGLHSATEKSGAVYLGPGRHPIRADWFNGPELAVLQVEYAGPGLPRQKIPDAALFWADASTGTASPVHGLDYRAYEGQWDRLPDFQGLAIVKSGTAANFDLRVRSRDEEVGLQFNGFVEVPHKGLYTFWITSDDGSRLLVGESSLRLTLLDAGSLPVARRRVPAQGGRDEDEGQWAEAEGIVTSVRDAASGGLQIEVSAGTNHLWLDVESASGPVPPLLSRIRATGICRDAGTADGQRAARGLMVPDLKQIAVLAPSPGGLSPQLTRVAQLRPLESTSQRILCPVRLEGVVVAASVSRGVLAFQDDSGAALVEMYLQGQELHPGQRVVVEGNCVVEGARVKMGNPVLADNDGLHIMIEKSGAMFLKVGKHAIRVAWFNRLSPSGLEVYYQGPDLPRQRVPNSALFRPVLDAATGAIEWRNGLDYRGYEGAWQQVPDATTFAPVKQGSTANFDIGVASRSENVGLEFSGFVEVPRDGVYTFSTISDDGSRLFLDEQAPRLEIIGTNALPAPSPLAARQVLREDEPNRWSQVEGTVTFVSEESAGLELELSSGTGRMRVEVADGSGRSPLLLLKSRIRAVGICQSTYTTDGQRVAGTLLTPSMKQIELLEVAPAQWDERPVLPISALAVTNFLKASETIVRIRGKVRSENPGGVLLVEDETGQILVETTQPLPQKGLQVEVLGRWSRARTNLVLRSGFYRELAGKAEDAFKGLSLLTSVEQVKRLSRGEAQRGHPVKIRGVVTAPQVGGFFMQDSTWSIYVRLRDPAVMELPRAGEYCEVEGVTFAEFAPNVRAHRLVRLGAGVLPEPLHPTWDQLINGSLDTQYVEVQGVVTGVEPDGVALLTRAGKIKVQLPEADPQTLKQYVNALVRLRGCVIPGRDLNTQQVELGRMRLSNFSVNVDEPPPADPFATPLKHVPELLLFDPRAGAISRVKLAGQVLHERSGEYFLMEGTNGLRFIPPTAVKLNPGDLVEVVGFPEMGGPSPVLREAVVRQTGKASLPAARPLAEGALLSRQYDATLVRVESRLAGISIRRSDQVLELQAGTRGFVARLDASHGVLRGIAPGSLLELTGVYAGNGGDRASGRDIDSFELLLNAPSDIKVLEQPSWWTISHTLTVVGGMALVIVVALVWITLLRRQVEERSRQLTVEIQRREQTERQRALEEERARIARDLHDDLGATLTQIRLLSALESRDAQVPETTRARLGQVTEKSREMVASLDEIVWAVNPANDSLPSLATYLCQFAEEFFRPTSIRCRLDVDDSLPPVALTSEVRHHLYLAVREALNNIAKHSAAAELWLRIQWQPPNLRISIEDNGRGFSHLAGGAAGDGLPNMRRRLEHIGGHFECQTQPGAGTICRIWLPLDRGPSGKREA